MIHLGQSNGNEDDAIMKAKGKEKVLSSLVVQTGEQLSSLTFYSEEDNFFNVTAELAAKLCCKVTEI